MQHSIELLLADEWTLHSLFVLRISHFDGLSVADTALDELVIDGLMNISPGASNTALSRVAKENAGLLNGKVHLSISTDDVS